MIALTGKKDRNKVSKVACNITEAVLHLLCIMLFQPLLSMIFSFFFFFWTFKINSREGRECVKKIERNCFLVKLVTIICKGEGDIYSDDPCRDTLHEKINQQRDGNRKES